MTHTGCDAVMSSDVVDIQASSCDTNCSNLVYSNDSSTTYWCPDNTDVQPWALVDLGKLYHVTGVRFHLPSQGPTLEEMRLLASSDGLAWLDYGSPSLGVEVSLDIEWLLYVMVYNRQLKNNVNLSYIIKNGPNVVFYIVPNARLYYSGYAGLGLGLGHDNTGHVSVFIFFLFFWLDIMAYILCLNIKNAILILTVLAR